MADGRADAPALLEACRDSRRRASSASTWRRSPSAPAASSARCCSARSPDRAPCPSRATPSRRRSSAPASASPRASAASRRASRPWRRAAAVPAKAPRRRRRHRLGASPVRAPRMPRGARRAPQAARPRSRRSRRARAPRRLSGPRLRAKTISLRLEPVAEAERRHGDGSGRLLAETARQLALGMAYEDTIRVAELKIRAARFARVREEVRRARRADRRDRRIHASAPQGDRRHGAGRARAGSCCAGAFALPRSRTPPARARSSRPPRSAASCSSISWRASSRGGARSLRFAEEEARAHGLARPVVGDGGARIMRSPSRSPNAATSSRAMAIRMSAGVGELRDASSAVLDRIATRPEARKLVAELRKAAVADDSGARARGGHRAARPELRLSRKADRRGGERREAASSMPSRPNRDEETRFLGELVKVAFRQSARRLRGACGARGRASRGAGLHGRAPSRSRPSSCGRTA